MIFLKHENARGVADLIARDMEGATVVAGEVTVGIPLRWKAPSSLTVACTDEELAEELSAKLHTKVVFAMSYTGTFGGELAVYDDGILVRRIVDSEDGIGIAGEPTSGPRFPFEADVFDLDDDDDTARSLSESAVREFCRHLGIVIEAFVPAQWTVLAAGLDAIESLDDADIQASPQAAQPAPRNKAPRKKAPRKKAPRKASSKTAASTRKATSSKKARSSKKASSSKKPASSKKTRRARRRGRER